VSSRDEGATTTPAAGQGDAEPAGPGLEPLAATVKEAADRLRQLRQMNQELTQKVRELEAHLTSRAGGGAAAGADPAWEAQWAEIRRRVEALARHLERLAAS
jgi:hypothetical protein